MNKIKITSDSYFAEYYLSIKKLEKKFNEYDLFSLSYLNDLFKDLSIRLTQDITNEERILKYERSKCKCENGYCKIHPSLSDACDKCKALFVEYEYRFNNPYRHIIPMLDDIIENDLENNSDLKKNIKFAYQHYKTILSKGFFNHE